MIARTGQPYAIRRALDLDQPLGAAANRADLVVDRRTAASRFPRPAQGANHDRLSTDLCVRVEIVIGA